MKSQDGVIDRGEPGPNAPPVNVGGHGLPHPAAVVGTSWIMEKIPWALGPKCPQNIWYGDLR